MLTYRRIYLALAVLPLLAGGASYSRAYAAKGAPDAVQYFPETQHLIAGRFLQYWQQHGGLAQQGYPISEQFQEKSDTDGKTYAVQYFERAVFEAHPENAAPNDVLLSQLGKFQIDARYPNGSNPAARKAVLIPDPPGKVMLPYVEFDTKDVLVLGGQTRGKTFHPAAGNKYALVFTIVYNLKSTDPPTHIDSDAVRMEDGAGRTYNLAPDDIQREAAYDQAGYPRMLYNFSNIYSDNVPPAGHLYETLVFEVPSNSTVYNLILGQ